jgi:hypothetical protein
MRLIKLTMIEHENTTEGEDDTVQVTATTGTVYVNPEHVRSIHERKGRDESLPRPAGTRLAFNNGSQFSVTESIDEVAALMAPTLQ